MNQPSDLLIKEEVLNFASTGRDAREIFARIIASASALGFYAQSDFSDNFLASICQISVPEFCRLRLAFQCRAPSSPTQVAKREITLIDEKTMARRLGVSYRAIINFRVRRLIPHVRLGRLVRYNPEAVAKAIEKLTIKEQT